MAETQIELPLLRAKQPSPGVGDQARLQRLVLLAVFFAHAAGWLVLEQLARYRPAVVDTREETSITIEFVAEQSSKVDASPTATSMAEREQVPTPRTVPRRTPTVDAGVAIQFLPRDQSPEPVIDARRLFTPDGSVRLPQGSAPAAVDPFAPPAPVSREPALTHRSTRFDRAWTPDGENLGQEIVRKFPPADAAMPPQGCARPAAGNGCNVAADSAPVRPRRPQNPLADPQPAPNGAVA